MSVKLLNQDRIAEIFFAKPFDEHRLVFELTGPSSNLFFIGADSRITAAYYPVTPSEHSTRTMLPGTSYIPPQKKAFHFADENVPGVDEGLSPNKAAAAFYERLAGERLVAAVRSEVRSNIRKALIRAERKREALASDLQTAERAEEFKQAGDLILANLKSLRTGMDHAELTGYDGRTVIVKLDPTRSPSKNAEQQFKRFKKAKAGQQIIAIRLHDASEDVSRLKSLGDAAEKTDDLPGLDSIRSLLSSCGFLKEKSQAKVLTSPAKKAPGFKTVVYRGWEILVGTSAAGNDHITTKVARPDDFWLHAEGLPGSHVLVRNAKKGDIPPDVLMKAAALAAFYSKGRHAGKVPVTYTHARNVKKPKGAKAGLVTLLERKTVVVRPEGGMSA
jgi:predicted ribosome quality control (RQC) complex YloA/Tae2 family protein